ncbi:MAG: helix-turn-helix domain-containing protein [Lachnospiraceae bacterium]|nr:helix-turn-helix domain-containing protein [Lachnospiraceae bacterium]
MGAIKELRTEKKLTQQQVAQMLGISLRSYKSYENDEDKVGTLKYNYILDKLNAINPLDEEHGILELDIIKAKCGSVFSEYPVHYCVLFGSYAKGKAMETSDVDLLVSSDVKGLKFYGMVEKLRTALHKKVDVLSLEQLRVNLELTDEILKDGIRIYKQPVRDEMTKAQFDEIMAVGLKQAKEDDSYDVDDVFAELEN